MTNVSDMRYKLGTEFVESLGEYEAAIQLVERFAEVGDDSPSKGGLLSERMRKQLETNKYERRLHLDNLYSRAIELISDEEIERLWEMRHEI